MKPTSISRSSPSKRGRNHESSFYKFLKPGALAQLRDSKINSLTRLSIHHGVDSLQPTPRQIPSVFDLEQVPCFLMTKVMGTPCCPKRKRLVAARSVFLLNLGPNQDVLEPNSSNSDNGSLISV